MQYECMARASAMPRTLLGGVSLHVSPLPAPSMAALEKLLMLYMAAKEAPSYTIHARVREGGRGREKEREIWG